MTRKITDADFIAAWQAAGGSPRYEMFPGMRDPKRALGESLAFSEGYIHQYWCSESHREGFDDRAHSVIEALRRRGWKLERLP